MSFTISGISNLNTQINRIQTTLEMRNQKSNKTSMALFGKDMASSNLQNAYSTYNSKGKFDKAEFDGRMISNTFDNLHQRPFSSAFNAYNQSYNFNKQVLGAYANVFA